MNTVATIFNLGGPDMIIILLIMLFLFGAKKLPELARGMGQAFKEFNKAKDEFEREVTKPVESSLTVEAPKDRLEHKPEAPVTEPKPQNPA